MSNTISRKKLRGKKLDDDCKRAKISNNEYGVNDNRQYCFGLIDCSTEEALRKCVECGAYVLNAYPI